MNPVVTIAIPVYKRLHYLPGALRSVLAQDYPVIDLLVSDNGENGPELPALVAEHYPRPHRFRRNPRTVPITEHYNQLIDAAEGDYYVLLSDDDEIGPSFVSSLVERLERTPGAHVGIGSVEAFAAEDGRIVSATTHQPLPPERMSGSELLHSWCAQRHRYVSFTTNVARTTALRAVGKYPDFERGNGFDNALLMKLALGREVVFSPQALFRHRIDDVSFGKAVGWQGLALASRQFLSFLDRDPQLRAFARAHPDEWPSLREAVRSMIWGTYLARWKNLYRQRGAYWQWVRGGFALPFIPAYYRQVAAHLFYDQPSLAGLARALRGSRARAS
ncbi:glycosyltransferase [Chloroflexales bacterium ZM16-3]|nr:glycosyltransferase [Chloroflexales bacterium ZM16-3]